MSNDPHIDSGRDSVDGDLLDDVLVEVLTSLLTHSYEPSRTK